MIRNEKPRFVAVAHTQRLTSLSHGFGLCRRFQGWAVGSLRHCFAAKRRSFYKERWCRRSACVVVMISDGDTGQLALTEC